MQARHIPVKLLQWRLQALRLGAPCLMVGALLLTAAVLWGWFVPQQGQTDRRVQQQALALKQALVDRDAAAQSSTPGTQQGRLERFEDTLADPRHVEQQVATILAIGQSLELELNQGQYRMQCIETARLCTYRMTLPVKGRYVALRALVEQTLATLPFASLDEITLRRESAGDDELDARLTFSLHLKPRPEWVRSWKEEGA